MDLYSNKRAVGWISALRKGSGPTTRGSRDETIQFCNRIGCSGRLNHATHTGNNFLNQSKSVQSSSRSPVSNVKKEPRKKTSLTTSTNSSTGSDESKIQNLHSSKLKSKSRETDSNKVGPMPAGRKVETSSSNTKIRKVNGQDSQITSFDSGKRRNLVKKGETSSSSRGKKIIEPSSVRTRRPHLSVESTRDLPQTEGFWLSEETSANGSTPNMSVVSINHHGSGRYNVDAIANVLLALERIEQDEELTYEQILSLEANSLLREYNLYDQHRDMRLDIDNMSYEELLALEEEMGIVSTALSEDELSKCLKISLYEPLHTRKKGSWCLDNSKCSICQEEFMAGDEIGKVGCGHGYHAVCINQWLQLKNWCPVCKVSAKPS